MLRTTPDKNISNKILPSNFAERVLELEIKVQTDNPNSSDIQALLEMYSVLPRNNSACSGMLRGPEQ